MIRTVKDGRAVVMVILLVKDGIYTSGIHYNMSFFLYTHMVDDERSDRYDIVCSLKQKKEEWTDEWKMFAIFHLYVMHIENDHS